MKKMISLTFLLFLSVFIIHAQEGDAKKWLISMNTPVGGIFSEAMIIPGGVGFVKMSDEDYEQSTFFLGGTIGYEIIDNLYGGLNLSFSKSTEDDDYTSTSLLVGPQARYYIPFEKTALFVGANAAFGSFKMEYDGEDDKVDLSGFGGLVGYAYSVNSTLDIEAQLSYDSVKAKYEDDDSTVDFLAFRIGFSLHL
jgi:hypothetical protein